MSITAGFITYNKDSLKYLPYFLPSLKKALEFDAQARILMVDNSENFSYNLDYVQKNYPSIEIISSGSNLGFAKAYNLMIKSASNSLADYFFIINPDTLITSQAISLLKQALEADPSLAAVSPKIFNWPFPKVSFGPKIDSLGIIEKKGLRFIDKAQGEFNRESFSKEILAPSGAAGLFRLESLKAVKSSYGYFDERFFLYKEDVDLAYRMKLKGQKTMTVLEAQIAHDRSLSSKSSKFLFSFKGRDKQSRFGRSQSFINQHLLYCKYFHLQSFSSKLIIVFRIIAMFIFALVKERFLLKNYAKIITIKKEIKKAGI
ncbi:MAG: glycosyltransferase family 2 protein [Candidatus Pacebacteria bacterium]|nr:glycosyltransferase family 2 protein [Candidatus Paceibacterota bacterium]